jgi:signal transduction histidine kinase
MLDESLESLGDVAREAPAPLREALERLRASLERDVSEMRRTTRALATAQADAIVSSAMLVSDLEQAREELRAKAREAEQASQAKSMFLATMSHELRTPLTAIIGFGELLKEDVMASGAPRWSEDLEKIVASGRQLLGIVNDVISLSALQAGRLVPEATEFRLDDLATRAIAAARPLADAANNTLRLEGSVGTVWLDEDKTRLVLGHLLRNACKFTHSGRITVRLSAPWVGGDDKVALQVIDTGIGVARERQAELFEEFAQIDGSRTRLYGGTGLGLAITRRLCRLMGGEVEIESEFGGGSTFTVSLPRDLRRVPALV